MAATSAASQKTTTAGVATDQFNFTRKWKQVTLRNTHATQAITVKVQTGISPAAVLAKCIAAPAVIGADDTVLIPAGQRVVLLKSTRAVFAGFAHIASGATTTFITEGSEWKD